MTTHLRTTIGAGISALALIVLACGSSTTTPTVKTATPASAATTAATAAPAATEAVQATEAPTLAPTEAPTQAPAASKLGDTVEQDGFSLTATAVQDPCKPSIIYKAKAGTRIVGVEVILANVSNDKPLSVDPLYGTLVDSEGFTYKAELAGCETQIDVVELAKGEKVKGIIGFEVPAEAKLASIKFSLGMFSSAALQAGLTK